MGGNPAGEPRLIFSGHFANVPIWMIAAGHAEFDHLSYGGAGRQFFWLDPVDFAESLVPDQKSVLGIEHAQPMRHVGERRVETRVLFGERAGKFALFLGRKQQAQAMLAQILRNFDGR